MRPAKLAVPGHSFLGEGSLDPAPAEGGRASREALDILQLSEPVKAPQSISAGVTAAVSQGHSGGFSWLSVTPELQRVETSAG